MVSNSVRQKLSLVIYYTFRNDLKKYYTKSFNSYNKLNIKFKINSWNILCIKKSRYTT